MNDKSKALVYILLSTLSFCFMSVTVKYIQTIPVFQKVFFRNSISLFMALYIILKSKPQGLHSFTGKLENQKYLFPRALMGLIGVFLNFYATTNLKLADSQILNRLSPVWVSLFALIFLKEKLSKYQIISIVIALFGAILVVKPQFSFEMLPGLAGFTSAITAGAAYTILRHLRGKESPATIIFYFSLFSLVGSFPLMMTNFITPTPLELLFLLLTGVFASFGQLGLTHAYRHAKASQVSIYTYSGIVMAGIIGFIIWREIPDLLSIIGALLIVTSAYIVYKKSTSQSQS